MTNNEFDKSLFENGPPSEFPVVKRNKNEKTISVKSRIGEEKIPIKVIAPYEKWLEFEKLLLKHEHLIKFGMI